MKKTKTKKKKKTTTTTPPTTSATAQPMPKFISRVVAKESS